MAARAAGVAARHRRGQREPADEPAAVRDLGAVAQKHGLLQRKLALIVKHPQRLLHELLRGNAGVDLQLEARDLPHDRALSEKRIISLF